MEPWTVNDAAKRILTAVHEYLKPLGFKKRGQNFIRENDEVVQAFQMQRSAYSTRQEISFTFNFGLHSKDVDRIRGAVRPPLMLGISGLQQYERIGFIIPENRDVWLEIKDSETEAAAESKVREMVSRYMVPLFGRAYTAEGLLDTWTKPMGHHLRWRDETLAALTKAVEEKALNATI